MNRLLKWLEKKLLRTDSFGMRDELHVEVWHKGKKTVDRVMKGHCPTNVGFALVAALVGSVDSPAAVTYLALGTNDTAATAAQTALLGEITTVGLERAAAAVTRVTTTQTDDTLQLLKEWTATGSATVEEIGAFNDAAAGIMLARKLTGTIDVNDTDHVKMTYKFPFSAAV